MGAQTELRLEKFRTTFETLAELGEQPYHYGCHYSNIGSVLHFLIRLEPFTQLFLELQGGKFDFADRCFFSIDQVTPDVEDDNAGLAASRLLLLFTVLVSSPQTWALSSSMSTTDVKELIPEFFFLPELLSNLNQYQLGQRQSGEQIDDVILPVRKEKRSPLGGFPTYR